MKSLLNLLILLPTFCLGQVNPSIQSSEIRLIGNGNQIKVIQGKTINIYNLNNNLDIQKLVTKLDLISPAFKKLTAEIIANDNKNSSVTNRKLDILTNLMKSTFGADTIYNLKSLQEKIESLNLEKQTIKKEFEDFVSRNPSFEIIQEQALQKLNIFDIKGYHEILQKFGSISIKNASKAFTLSARAYEASLMNDSALSLIKTAYYYDSTDREIQMYGLIIARKAGPDSDVYFFYNKMNSHDDLNCFERLEIKKDMAYYLFELNKLDSAKSILRNCDSILYSCDKTYSMNGLNQSVFIRFLLGKILFKQKSYEVANNTIDAGKIAMGTFSKYKRADIRENYFAMHVRLAETYAEAPYYDSSIKFCNQALLILDSIDYTNKNYEREIILDHLGHYYTALGKIPLALDYFMKAINCLTDSEKEKQYLAGQIYYQIGYCYSEMGKPLVARSYLKKSKNILVNFTKQENFLKAIEIELRKVEGKIFKNT